MGTQKILPGVLESMASNHSLSLGVKLMKQTQEFGFIPYKVKAPVNLCALPIQMYQRVGRLSM